MTALWFAINALAVYRLARFLTRDTLIERPRNYFINRWMHGLYPHKKLAELIVCPWCCSVWFAAAVLLLVRYQNGWWHWVATGLAFSAVAGYLAEKE